MQVDMVSTLLSRDDCRDSIIAKVPVDLTADIHDSQKPILIPTQKRGVR